MNVQNNCRSLGPQQRGAQVIAMAVAHIDLPLASECPSQPPISVVLRRPVESAQFTSIDWAAFIRTHNLEHSMSRRGNCHDNAVAESFFNLLKRERIRRRTYKTRDEARQDVFDYIEMFYNPVRKHVRNGMLSPVEFERQQALMAQGV